MTIEPKGDSAIIKVAHMRADWLPTSENWLHGLIRNMPAEIENHVVCARAFNLDQFSVQHLHVTMAPRWARFSARARGIGRFVRRSSSVGPLRRISPDIIHSHFGLNGWENIPLARRLHIPHIVSFYGFDVSFAERHAGWRMRYREMFDQASAVLCEGPHMTSRIVALGARPEQMRLFRLGIDLGRLPYRPRSWDGAGLLRVLIAGRFTEKKGMPYALAALARIASRVPLEIHLVGDADETVASKAEKGRINDEIERGRLTDRVIRHGMIPYATFLDLANRCHIFLSPSVHAADGDTEGGAPVTIAEMAASGMPIVSTTHCDIPYAVGGNDNALLAPERDADVLADLLLKLVDHPNSWRPMLDRARAHVEQAYNAKIQGKDMAKVYGVFAGTHASL